MFQHFFILQLPKGEHVEELLVNGTELSAEQPGEGFDVSFHHGPDIGWRGHELEIRIRDATARRFGYRRTMIDVPDIAKVAALIGDPARANMLAALKDDSVLSAAELAQVAGVAPNTASGHLSKLVEVRMLRVEPQGRHRFFTLACAEVADALESLEALAARTEPHHRSRNAESRDVRFARSCYDHLAGQLGVEFAEALERLEYVDRTDRGFDLLDKGADAVTALGVDLNALRARCRRLLRAFPDWSEGSFHLGGALGAQLLRIFCENGWLRRRRGNRALDLTPIGRAAFRDRFEMKC